MGSATYSAQRLAVRPDAATKSLAAALNFNLVMPPGEEIHKAALSVSLALARANTSSQSTEEKTARTIVEEHDDLGLAIFSGAICGAIQHGLNKGAACKEDPRQTYLNGQADVREIAQRVLKSGDFAALDGIIEEESLATLSALATACKENNFSHVLIASIENGNEVLGIDTATAIRNAAFFVLAKPPVAIRDLAQSPARYFFHWDSCQTEEAA